MPTTGCPSDGVTEWKTGWTYHDTEDDNNENQRSNIFHMPGNFSAHGIQQKFCLKESNNGDSGSEIWPEGKYCLYKKGKRVFKIPKQSYPYVSHHVFNFSESKQYLPLNLIICDQAVADCCSFTLFAESTGCIELFFNLLLKT